MSFKPEISSVLIWNEALSLLPADPVQAEDEASLKARECRRWYKSVVAALLERHHWNLSIKREPLAVVTNDRANEWAFAYAKPTNMAYPVSLIPSTGNAYSGWVFDDYAYVMGGRRLFMQSRGTIYSSVQAATLEFTSFDITEADFTTRFKDLVVEGLAAKLATPIAKDDTKARALSQSFEFNTQRGIASDMNRNQPTYGNKPTETEVARGVGYDRTFAGTGYPIDPVAHPSNTGL